MNVRTLLEELRERDICLKVDGLLLHVDAPAGAVTGELRSALREQKRALIRHLERERVRLEQAGRRGLIIGWSKEPGYVSIHDPATGEWHEIAASGCPTWILEDARRPSTWSSSPTTRSGRSYVAASGARRSERPPGNPSAAAQSRSSSATRCRQTLNANQQPRTMHCSCARTGKGGSWM